MQEMLLPLSWRVIVILATCSGLLHCGCSILQGKTVKGFSNRESYPPGNQLESAGIRENSNDHLVYYIESPLLPRYSLS